MLMLRNEMLVRSCVAGSAAASAAVAASVASSYSGPTYAAPTRRASRTATVAPLLSRRSPLPFHLSRTTGVAAYSSAAAATAAVRGGAAPAPPPKATATTKSNPPQASSATAFRSSTGGDAVPDVLVTFGNQADRLTFVSHPGVMAVAKLLEMSYLTEHRAVLTQENVDAIREYDEELSKKAQIAVDNGLAVNFQKLDFFDRPEFVEMFKREKELLQKARAEVLAAPKGRYAIPACVAKHTPVEIPRRWRTDLELTEEMVRVDPALRAQTELRSLIVEHLSQKEIPERALPTPSQPKKQIT